jgi:flagellar biosynthesis protein FlhG
MCRLNGTADIDDVLVGRETLQQAIVAGPAGIQVLPRFGIQVDAPSTSCRRLIRHLDTVNRTFDYVIIDAGSCPLTAEVLWPTATQAIVLTTTDYVAVTDAYALIKSMTRQQVITDIGFVVNKFTDEALANDVAQRLLDSCTRFLELEVTAFGTIGQDLHVAKAATNGRMVTSAFPDAASTLAIAELAEQLAAADIDSNGLNSLMVA